MIDKAARHYAGLRAALEEYGEPMGNPDLMIAAQALAAGAALVTHDRVFRRVKGLKVEDWSKRVVPSDRESVAELQSA